MDYLKRLYRQCLNSRALGNGGLDEIGCRCEYCKIDIHKYRQWNNKARKGSIKERKYRLKVKQFNQSNSRWMLNFVPHTNNMDRGMLDFLLDRLTYSENFSVKDRNYVQQPKAIYWVKDVPGFRAPIYKNDPNPTL